MEENTKKVYHNQREKEIVEKLHFVTKSEEKSYNKHNILCREKGKNGIFWRESLHNAEHKNGSKVVEMA